MPLGVPCCAPTTFGAGGRSEARDGRGAVAPTETRSIFHRRFCNVLSCCHRLGRIVFAVMHGRRRGGDHAGILCRRLGSLPGSANGRVDVNGWGLNNLGQVAGYGDAYAAGIDPPTAYGFVWSNGTYTTFTDPNPRLAPLRLRPQR